jgi:glycosyltransferase involved in cell wall biosynthesis
MSPSRDCLLLSTAGNIGGMERAVCSLSRGLSAHGWSIRTLFPGRNFDRRLVDWCRDQGVEAETCPAILDAGERHSIPNLVRLGRFVRERNPGIINLHYGSNFMSLKDMVAVRASSQVRVVVTVHSAEDWGTLGTRKRRMTRFAAGLADVVVVPTEETETLLVEAGVDRRRIQLIPCGVRLPERLPSRAEARSRFGLPDSAFVIATLARLVPGKGIRTLIEAAGLLRQRNPEVLLVIGGDGPERPGLEQSARELLGDSCTFLGALIGDTSDFYANADVFVLPSYYEAQGLVYLEAALHGVPSVGTDVGGTRRAVVDQVTGLLVPPGDPTSLAKAVERLRADSELRRRLGRDARHRARNQFTDTVMADRYSALFHDLG